MSGSPPGDRLFSGPDCRFSQPGVPSLGHALKKNIEAGNARLPFLRMFPPRLFIGDKGIYHSTPEWNPVGRSSQYGSLCVHPNLPCVLGRVCNLYAILARRLRGAAQDGSPPPPAARARIFVKYRYLWNDIPWRKLTPRRRRHRGWLCFWCCSCALFARCCLIFCVVSEYCVQIG